MEAVRQQFSKMSVSSPIPIVGISFARDEDRIAEVGFFCTSWNMRDCLMFHVQTGRRRHDFNLEHWYVVKDKLIDLLLASNAKIVIVFDEEEAALLKNVIDTNVRKWEGLVYNIESMGCQGTIADSAHFKVSTIWQWIEEKLLK